MQRIASNKTFVERNQTEVKEEERDEAMTTMMMTMAEQIEHCFYQGVVEGEIDSAVALSLCNGMVSWVAEMSSPLTSIRW